MFSRFLAVCLGLAICLVGVGSVNGATHKPKPKNPAACFRQAGWIVKPGSSTKGGSAKAIPGTYHYVTWLRIHIPGIPFLTYNSGDLTKAQYQTQLSCVGKVTVPNVAP
jgi:hypothetical protein